MKKQNITGADLIDESEHFPSDLDSDASLAQEEAAGEGKSAGKSRQAKAATRRFPLQVGERPKPQRLTDLEAGIMDSVRAMVDDIEVLDGQIEEMHLLLEQLMYGTRKAVGVAWGAHRTRAGLHPVAYRQGDSKRATVVLRQGRSVKRFWVTELNPPVRLARFALGDPAADEWLVRAQKDVLRALENLLSKRARAIGCLTGQRKSIAAWEHQVRPGLSGLPVAQAFETKEMVRRIEAEHFVKAYARGASLAGRMQAGADAAREQDAADLVQRPN